MEHKEKISVILKYLGAFLFCNILLCFVMWLITELDKEKLELIDCFVFENRKIKEIFDYQSYLQGHCSYSQMCACAITSEWILMFYIWALPIFVLHEFIKRKIVSETYRYLCAFGEIAFWLIVWFLKQDNAPYLWFTLKNTYEFIAPMAIILLSLNALPLKVLKILAIIIGAIYGVYWGFLIVMIIPNFFG